MITIDRKYDDELIEVGDIVSFDVLKRGESLEMSILALTALRTMFKTYYLTLAEPTSREYQDLLAERKSTLAARTSQEVADNLWARGEPYVRAYFEEIQKRIRN